MQGLGKEVDKHDERHDGTHPTSAGDQRDPAGSHSPADHRPGQAQDHPAQAGAAGQVSEVADQGSGGIAGDEHDPVGDHLHITGRTDLRGGRKDVEKGLSRIGAYKKRTPSYSA